MSESFQGVGPDFFPADYARAWPPGARSNDVLLIMDEVQAGFGRTGKWFAFENYGITPDLIACGKGISSSLPLSAVIGRPDVMELYPPGSMTSTHSGSPLPVAAAVANIRRAEEGRLPGERAGPGPGPPRRAFSRSRSATRGRPGACRAGASSRASRSCCPAPGRRIPRTALAVNEACFRRGLLMFAPVGVAGECIKIAPALDMSREALEEGIATLGEAMDEVLS